MKLTSRLARIARKITMRELFLLILAIYDPPSQSDTIDMVIVSPTASVEHAGGVASPWSIVPSTITKDMEFQQAFVM